MTPRPISYLHGGNQPWRSMFCGGKAALPVSLGAEAVDSPAFSAPLVYQITTGYPPSALAVSENTLLAWVPISRMVPTTMTRMTASITAYSAMS